MNVEFWTIKRFCEQNPEITFVLFALVGGVLLLTVFDFRWLWLKRILRADKDRQATHGSARFAERDEIETKNLFHNGHNLMTLASYEGKFIGAPVHTLVCAPTGTGKGVGVVIPTLLNYRGSVLVNDPKGENLKITARCREEMGQEIVSLDPWGKGEARCGRTRYQCNPLAYIDADSLNVITQVNLLVRAICGERVDGGANSIFYETAENLIAFFILYVLQTEKDESKRNLVYVRKLCLSKPETYKEIFEKSMQLTNCNGELATAAESFIATAFDSQGRDSLQFTTAFQSFLSNVKNNFRFLEDLHLQEFFSGNTYNLRSVQSEPTSVYLVVDAGKADIASVFTRIVYNTILSPMLEVENPAGLPLLVVVDELEKLGKFKLIEKSISIVRSNGIRFLLIIQNIEQLKKCYDKGAADIEANTQLVAFSPATFEAQQHLSRRLGKTTIQVFSVNDKGMKTRSKTSKDLLSIEELARLDEDTVFVFPLNISPIKAKKILYYHDKRFAGKFDER